MVSIVPFDQNNQTESEGGTYPTDTILQKAVQDMLPTQYRMPDETSQKVFEQSFPSGNHCRIFFRFGLTFDCVIRQRLFRRDGRYD